MRSDRYRVKLYRNPRMGRGVWGAFFVRRDGQVAPNSFVISTRGPGYVLDALARKIARSAKKAQRRKPAVVTLDASRVLPRGFDH